MKKVKLKDAGGFLLGFFVAIGILSFVFVGCSRIIQPTENDDVIVEDKIVQRDLMIGMQGADVLDLHQRLYELVPNDVTKDMSTTDDFDETTQFYVTLFQMSQNLEPDGVVDEQTMIALGNPTMPTEQELAKLKAMIPIDEDIKNEPEEPVAPPVDNSGSSNSAKKPSSSKKTAYLTFDDGPNPTYTPQIVELLNKYDAQATFFALGQEVDKYPKVAKDTSKGNDIVANHTYSHKDISVMSDSQIKKEIVDANTAVKNATGKTPICFRPPYGAMNADTKQKLGNAGGKTIMWDVDTQDWAKPGTDAIVEHVLDYTQDREIILMHDGGGDRTQTIEALKILLPKMTAEGWKFRALDCVR